MILSLNIPYVQRQLSAFVSQQLSDILGTQFSIGKIDIGMLNRIVVDDLLLHDQNGDDLLKITRLSVKFDILPLFHGDISISNIQLFGFNINIKKQTPESKANFQFIIDTFKPKQNPKKSPNLDLRINSLLIRRGKLSYRVISEVETPGRFNPHHIKLNNIVANISLKALQNDSINAAIKRLSVIEEYSNFELKKLSLRVIGNDHGAKINNFAIDLPKTSIQADTINLKYDSLGAFKNFTRDVQFSFHMQSPQCYLNEFAPFLPVFTQFKESLRAEMKVDGTVEQLRCTHLNISSDNRFQIQGEAILEGMSQPYNSHISGKLQRFYANKEGIIFLNENLLKAQGKTFDILQNLGSCLFQGEISGSVANLSTHGLMQTNLGDIKANLHFTSNKSQSEFTYTGNVQTENFDLGEMLNNKKLGAVTFNLDATGRHSKSKHPQILLKGLISSFNYNGYAYKDIVLDGKYENGGMSGIVALNDENASVTLNGSINTKSPVPTFNFLATIDHARPHELLLTPQYEGMEFSVKVKADFTGKTIDDMDGEINIDSLLFIDSGEEHFMNNLKISAIREKDERQLQIASDFLSGNITGNYSYRTLPASILNIVKGYVPSLTSSEKPKTREVENRLDFELHLYNTELLSAILQTPVRIYTHSTIMGFLDDKLQKVRVEGYFPRLRFKNRFIESAMFLCENPNDMIHTRLRFTSRNAQKAINLTLEAKAKNDSIKTVLNWGNNAAVTYSGKLAAIASFIKDIPNDMEGNGKTHPRNLKAVINIQPTDIILNDTLWKIHPSTVTFNAGKVHVDDFRFSQNKRHLHMDGTLSKSPQDTVRIDLQDISIDYIFDIANVGVKFRGEATGPVLACGVLDTPIVYTDLFVRNFGIYKGYLGDANIHAEWHHKTKGIYMDVDIKEKEIAHTHVTGFVYPIKPTSGLDLYIEADSTNLRFIHHFMTGITSDFQGRVTGDVRLYGRFKELTMEGNVVGDASMKVDVLNTVFSIKDSIRIHPEGMTFRNNRIFDTQGHSGILSGELQYEHFKNLRYRFDMNVHNMLVMNTQESPDFPFYGTVYATGSATIAGNVSTGVNINVAMATNRNSNFTYIKDNVSSATSTQFIKFVDKTPKRTKEYDISLSDYELAQREMKQEEEKTAPEIHLNIQVDATPDATMKIVMDPVAGDYISGRGSGNIRTEFYNKGDVKMFGSYRIEQGIYKFSLQEVIRKDFIIKEGSNILFNGSPMDATLDINATYTVNSASLNDLVPNAEEYVNQTNVKVDCIMGLTGPLTSPNIKLDIDLPNERDEVQALVRNYIPTDEQMNMQILYLLGIGKFYAQDYMGNTQSSNMMSSVLSSTLSGQLNNALSNIINNNNWNIGTNLSTGEHGWTDMEFEGMLSGQLLNNRLIINGNFGYRDNPLANTNFVGDFKAEWLLNRSGNIRLKAYNETNDRYYTRTNLTTQGIGIIFKKDFNKWDELFFWNRWRLKRIKAKRAAKSEVSSNQPQPSTD